MLQLTVATGCGHQGAASGAEAARSQGSATMLQLDAVRPQVAATKARHPVLRPRGHRGRRPSRS